MALRSTRQYVDVLGTGDGAARITRQYVEVLGAPSLGGSVYEVSAWTSMWLDLQHSTTTSISMIDVSTILLMDSDASCVLNGGGHADSTLTLSQAATIGLTKTPSATSTLSLSDSVGYIGPKWVDAVSAVLFDSAARVPETYVVAAISPIALTQSEALGGTRRLSAASSVSFVQLADTTTKLRYASTEITLSQVASFERILTVRSTIELSQSVILGAVLARAENTLNLSQTARYAPLPISVETQLSLGQSVWQSLHPVSATSILALGQSNTVLKPVRASGVSEITSQDWVVDPPTGEVTYDEIGLRHSADVLFSQAYSSHQYLQTTHEAIVVHLRADALTASASQTIVLSQAAILSKTAEATSYLTVSQAVSGGAGRPISNELDLSQSASIVIDRSTSLASILGLSQAAAYTLIIASTTSQYSPFIGASSDPDAPTPPPTTLQGPMAGIQVPFQLVYPAVGAVTDSISLRAPNLGNQDRLAFNRVQRETRGGTLVVFADPNWPKVQTLVLSFSGLKRVEAQGLLTFIENYIGKEIGLIDWEHRYWRGIITTPDQPIVEDSFDSFTANFEFQGELDPTWNPQVVPPSLRYSAIHTQQQDGYYVPNEPILPAMSETMDYYSAEADSQVKIGNALYLTASGHADLALGTAAGTSQVVGLSITDTASAATCKYITEGRVERSDWTEITGTVNLSPGVTYFLSPNTAGRLATAAPSTSGQYVVRVGRAVNQTTLDVEIDLPILL